MGGVPLPYDGMADRARDFAAGRIAPVEARNAASVVLLRGSPLEVYLLLRQRKMAFAAGMAVFPGGSVDPRDFDPDLVEAGAAGVPAVPAWAGPSPEEWGDRLGVDAALARALIYAAVRETFEESGVLLAGPTPDSVVADTGLDAGADTGAGWEADRVALIERTLSLTEFLARRRLVVRTDLLAPWALWVTPLSEPRRFRTWFFTAELPSEQRTRDVSTESSEVAWLPVTGALAAARGGSLRMMPPQFYTCAELLACADPAAALSTGWGRELLVVEPTVDLGEGDGRLVIPDRLVDLAGVLGQ